MTSCSRTPEEHRVLTHVATLVRERMRQRYLSMEDVAERAGVDPKTVARALQASYEAGNPVKLTVLARIAHALECDLVIRLVERPGVRA